MVRTKAVPLSERPLPTPGPHVDYVGAKLKIECCSFESCQPPNPPLGYQGRNPQVESTAWRQVRT